MTQPSNLQVLMMMMKKVMLATLSGVSNVGQLTTRQRTKGREGKVSERLPAVREIKIQTDTNTHIVQIQTHTNTTDIEQSHKETATLSCEWQKQCAEK